MGVNDCIKMAVIHGVEAACPRWHTRRFSGLVICLTCHDQRLGPVIGILCFAFNRAYVQGNQGKLTAVGSSLYRGIKWKLTAVHAGDISGAVTGRIVYRSIDFLAVGGYDENGTPRCGQGVDIPTCMDTLFYRNNDRGVPKTWGNITGDWALSSALPTWRL